jgi:hypothetical protein
MKRAAAAAVLAFACLTSGSAWAGGAFRGTDVPASGLSAYSVSIGSNGAVRYDLTGSATIGSWTGSFHALCGYDPKTQRASESITDSDGNLIQTVATCIRDPWETSELCSDWKISVKGFNADTRNWLQGLHVPISAASLFASDHAALAQAKKKAEAEDARRKTLAGRKVEMVPTATPTPHHYLTAYDHRPAALAAAGSGAPPAPPTPTPVYPAYGAVYTGGNPPATMKAGQVAMVPITVQNTSSQTWPAGGNFRLSFHWFRFGAQVVHDGDRTLMPSSVPPGATVNLMAKVTAPPTQGAATLQWDMVQEGVTWFADKGVPMSAPKSVNVTP